MAITIEDQPYAWSARGQKLMIVASSTETAQDGFQYGVTVTNNSTSQVFNFYISPAIDGRLYFDLQSLIQLRNREAQGNQLHNLNTGTLNDTSTWNSLDFSIAEWWIVGGILTEAEGSSVDGDEILVDNQYYQPTDGYKPNPNSGPQNVKFAMTNATSLAMSDRQVTTKYPPIFATWGITAGKVAIAVREEDYGLLYVPGSDLYLTTNQAHKALIGIYSSTGSFVSEEILLNDYTVEGLPVFPANLNARAGFTAKPSLFPDWRFYFVRIQSAINAQRGVEYIFWNECVYGNCECNWPNVRLAWVGARGGYEYFNFKKKSEYTTEVDRKLYKRPLFNNSPTIFYANDRGLNQRTNLAQRVLTVTSDYITQDEFIYLRGLIVSNQVHLINDNGTYIAVNIDDTSYVEKRTYDGKLYNLTLKVRMANEYWT
jgi:hypothetical protein